MKAKKKLDFLMAIAEMAFNNGADLTVELKDYQRSSNVVRGAISESESTDVGIVLHANHHDIDEEGDDE